MRLIARKRYWLVIIGCPVLGPRRFFRLTHSIQDQLMCLYSSALAEMQRLFSSIVFVARSFWILHVETKLLVGIVHWFLHFCIEKKSFCLELHMTDWPGGTSLCPALMLHQCLNRTRRKTKLLPEFIDLCVTIIERKNASMWSSARRMHRTEGVTFQFAPRSPALILHQCLNPHVKILPGTHWFVRYNYREKKLLCGALQDGWGRLQFATTCPALSWQKK